MLALALAVTLAATVPGVRSGLPPAPRSFTGSPGSRGRRAEGAQWKPREPGGVAVDPASGVVLFGTRDGWLHAIRDDGKIAWEFHDGGFRDRPPSRAKPSTRARATVVSTRSPSGPARALAL
jgi:hypothetical protein